MDIIKSFSFFYGDYSCVLDFRYKLWHYSGSILAQVDTPSGQELWESLWLPDMERKYPEKAVSYKKATSTVAAVKEGLL